MRTLHGFDLLALAMVRDEAKVVAAAQMRPVNPTISVFTCSGFLIVELPVWFWFSIYPIYIFVSGMVQD